MATNDPKLEELLVKINDNIVLLRKIQNVMVGAVADITRHNEDKQAHRKLLEDFQLGIDRKEMDKINSEVGFILLRVKTLGTEVSQLSERVSKLESASGTN